MTDTEILDNLRGATCLCGRSKASGRSHCRSDYYRLPPEKRQALYREFNHGYQEAFIDACKFLGLITDPMTTEERSS